MALSTKTIKRRIKSIANTKKITKAMEMISAVKMRRAVANASATRAYADLAWKMLQDVTRKAGPKHHPLLAERPIKKMGLILITSNRGLAGGFSSKLLQEVDAFITKIKKEKNVDVEVLVMGKKGRKIYQNFGHAIAAEFDKVDVTKAISDILPMSQLAATDFINSTYDQIGVAYMQYISAIKQVPIIKPIFPIKQKNHITVIEKNPQPTEQPTDFIFEPNPLEVLKMLLPRLIEMQLYQAVLESDASEHSARMMAMQAASDAASDMIKELNTTFNNARQAAITKEIAEVIGGAAALE